ncbi:MAG TPA: hypothetical protein DD400_05080 [Rhodospirillaceae bacterium]|nr:hypothetical protein [Rhodospirillaceae bacterium]
MKSKKLKIEKNKFDLNLKFYFLLKNLVKSKFTERQAMSLLEIINLDSKSKVIDVVDGLNEYISKIVSAPKREAAAFVIDVIETRNDIDLLLFSLKLYCIKDLLLKEAKITEVLDREAMKELDPLSLAYDKKSVYVPYSTRVNGALLSLLFFSRLEGGESNFMSESAEFFLRGLSREAVVLKKKGLEPNQIFMLMFSESINQSIISDSGVNYEDRILGVLEKIGIPKGDIKKIHDENDVSTEYDFFFELNGHTFGIGAKRTLRERYKQFIKTNATTHVDVMIEITLGLDLNEAKAKTILENGTKLFVSDEIYDSRGFLNKLKGVYPVSSLSLKTLRALI